MHKLSNRSGGVIKQHIIKSMKYDLLPTWGSYYENQKHVSLQTNTEIDKKELKMTNIKWKIKKKKWKKRKRAQTEVTKSWNWNW